MLNCINTDVCLPDYFSGVAMTYSCVGNCINSFDEDGFCLLDVFADTSNFACELEAAIPIARPNALKAPSDVPLSNLEFMQAPNGTVIGYDEEGDVHYFFVAHHSDDERTVATFYAGDEWKHDA